MREVGHFGTYELCVCVRVCGGTAQQYTAAERNKDSIVVHENGPHRELRVTILIHENGPRRETRRVVLLNGNGPHSEIGTTLIHENGPRREMGQHSYMKMLNENVPHRELGQQHKYTRKDRVEKQGQ